jgi:hypothetical protein
VISAALGGLVELAPESIKVPLIVLVALTMLCAMAANFINWRRNDDDDWFQGRAVAESVKTVSWRYMMRAEPFSTDGESDREFSRRLSAILGDCRHLRQELGGMATDAPQITPRMREVRRLGVRKRLDVYLRERLDRQIEWYHDKAQLNGRLAERWFWASFSAELVALVIALLAISVNGLINLVGMVAAIAVAFAAWTQLGRHNELNKSYGLAWQELLAIKDTARSANTEDELQSLVRSGEDAISREHTMWVAKHG